MFGFDLLTVTTLKVKGQMFQSIHQIIYFNPQVNLFTMNSIEIIHAPRKSGKCGIAEQRSSSGGSKLIEQTILVLHIRYLQTIFVIFFQEVMLSFLNKKVGLQKRCNLSLPYELKTIQNLPFFVPKKYLSCSSSIRGHLIH